jgi:hypothetical protein
VEGVIKTGKESSIYFAPSPSFSPDHTHTHTHTSLHTHTHTPKRGGRRMKERKMEKLRKKEDKNHKEAAKASVHLRGLREEKNLASSLIEASSS